MKEGKRTGLKANSKETEIILDYLEENASDVLAQKIHDGKKTMDDCWKFIYECAKKAAAGKNCYGCADQEVFGWAVHFFEEDSIKAEDIVKDVPVKSENPKKEVKKAAEQKNKSEEKKEEKLPGQMTIFDFGFGG
jgi:hypothetical protein